MSRSLGVGLVLAGLSAASVARAEPGSGAQLSYARSEKVSGCPDRAALRSAVSRRLGYDPFLAAARQTIIVEIAPEGTELVGRVRLVDDDGVVRGARDLRAATSECPELVASLALAISITLDPAAAFRDETPVDPAPEPEPAKADAEPEAPQASPSAPSPAPPAPRDQPTPANAGRSLGSKLALSLRGGGSLSIGLAPAPSVGLFAGAALGMGPYYNVVADFRADLPASTSADGGGSVAVSLLTGNLAGCAGMNWWAVCALGSLGSLHAEGADIALARSEATFHAAVGARYEIRVQLADAIALVVAADALWNLTPVSLQLNAVEVWSSPTFASTLGAGLAYDLL